MQSVRHGFRALSTAAAPRRAVLVDGTRTPFLLSQDHFKDYIAYDLGRFAIKGLMAKTGLEPNEVDYVLMGSVAQDILTHNFAREAALGAGLPKTVPAHTVSMACISANVSIASGAEKILSGQADVVIGGGAETFSDAPIRFSRKLRQNMIGSQKAKGAWGKIQRVFKGVGLADLAPQTPAIKNFATGEMMGSSSDRLCARWGVSREEQDQFAMASHINAHTATVEGLLKDEITAVDGHLVDNAIKADSTMEKMAKLKPAFIKPHGTHTAANSSGFSDGGAACLVMSEEKALALGYTPKAVIKAWTFVAVDPWEEMLLGPAYSIAKVLQQQGLTVADIGTWEIHEAFAGQVLANLNALNSPLFLKDLEKIGVKRDTVVGEVPRDKLNNHGGSLALGHPFGATGARITTTCANRMIREGSKYGFLSACADSGQAVGMLLENYQMK